MLGGHLALPSIMSTNLPCHVTKGDRTNLRPLGALELRTIPDNPQVQPFNQVFSIYLFQLVRNDPNIPLVRHQKNFRKASLFKGGWGTMG